MADPPWVPSWDVDLGAMIIVSIPLWLLCLGALLWREPGVNNG